MREHWRVVAEGGDRHGHECERCCDNAGGQDTRGKGIQEVAGQGAVTEVRQGEGRIGLMIERRGRRKMGKEVWRSGWR